MACRDHLTKLPTSFQQVSGQAATKWQLCATCCEKCRNKVSQSCHVHGYRATGHGVVFWQLRQQWPASPCSLLFHWANRREALSPFLSLPIRWHDPSTHERTPTVFLASSFPMTPWSQMQPSATWVVVSWFTKSSQQHRLMSPCSSPHIGFRKGGVISPSAALCNSPPSLLSHIPCSRQMRALMMQHRH